MKLGKTHLGQEWSENHQQRAAFRWFRCSMIERKKNRLTSVKTMNERERSCRCFLPFLLLFYWTHLLKRTNAYAQPNFAPKFMYIPAKMANDYCNIGDCVGWFSVISSTFCFPICDWSFSFLLVLKITSRTTRRWCWCWWIYILHSRNAPVP